MTQSPSHLSQLKDFLSYLTTIKGDLSNITAPPFVLAPKSVTEIPACWGERHSLFLQPAQEADPARRALLVLKNFLCSQKRQVVVDPDGGVGGARKPLNAFLGELFVGTFEGADGDGDGSATTRLVCEQVSHRPPVTACVLYNAARGVSSAACVAQETTYGPAAGVRVRQRGHAVVRDDANGESHLVTLPTVAVKGLLTGRPYPELEGTCYISSSSGFLATIEFGGKKALLGLGSRNSVRAEVSSIRDGGRVLFEISGQWSGRLTVKDVVHGTVMEEFDVDDEPLTELKIKPLEEQSPWESRRAWSKVIEGIHAGDMRLIGDEKNKIEDAQREIRLAEEKVGIEWPRLFFQQCDQSEEYTLLARAIPDEAVTNLSQERTAGTWKFIGVGPAEALIDEGIYHRSLEPTGQVNEE
ncbi:Oxysterol-binding protein [Xylariaceae sp. FL0662B]|nr:Oxysterol-binding protein [Xylariaceae sp. FL0662B]